MTLHPATAKPVPCRVCGGRAGLEHITEAVRPAASVAPLLPWALVPMLPQPRRYAQVVCRICDARGMRSRIGIVCTKTEMEKMTWHYF